MRNRFERWLLAGPKPKRVEGKPELKCEGGPAYRQRWREVPRYEIDPADIKPLSDPQRRYRFGLRLTFLVMLMTTVAYAIWHFAAGAVPTAYIFDSADGVQGFSRWWGVLGIGTLAWCAVRYLTTDKLFARTIQAWRFFWLYDQLFKPFIDEVILEKGDDEAAKERKKNRPYGENLWWPTGRSPCFTL